MKLKWKQGQLLPTFDYTLTLLNRVKATDSTTGLDVWKKTVLKNCAFSSRAIRNVQGSNTVSLGSAYVVRIPKNDDYKPYNEWYQTLEGFTFSTGDYIIKGEISEDVSPKNVVSLINKYRPDAFEIRLFKDNTGTVELLEHYHIEGV